MMPKELYNFILTSTTFYYNTLSPAISFLPTIVKEPENEG